MEKKKDLQDIVEILSKHSLRDQIELLANVFIHIGSAILGWPRLSSPTELIAKLAEYRKRNGETLAGALIQQGVVLMIWLEKDIGDRDE